MKQSAIFFYFSAALCCLSISAYSQGLGGISWQNYPNRFYTPEEVRQEWISTHWDVYGEDISNEPWAQSFYSFWNHAIAIGSLPPSGWGIAPHPYGYLSDSPLPWRADGIVLSGVWPVFLFLTQKDELGGPEWCTLQFFLDNLRFFQSSVLEPLFDLYAHPPSSSYRFIYDPPRWDAHLFVSNAVTKTEVLTVRLPYTRLFWLAPYYPAWWALGAHFYPMTYDYLTESTMQGEEVGPNCPYLDLDGYVCFARLRHGVKMRQVIKWTSTGS